jgi:hypothetical protein
MMILQQICLDSCIEVVRIASIYFNAGNPDLCNDYIIAMIGGMTLRL